MSRRLLIFLLLFTLQYFAIGQNKKVFTALNPTGTYKLNSKTQIRHRKTYGYNGSARIKLINSDRIAVSLYICIGAPSSNSGTLVDTLIYRHNRAVYHPEDDTSCRISFYFTDKGVTINQVRKDLYCGCGFGFKVFADGYYKKVSGRVPVIKDEAKD